MQADKSKTTAGWLGLFSKIMWWLNILLSMGVSDSQGDLQHIDRGGSSQTSMIWGPWEDPSYTPISWLAS